MKLGTSSLHSLTKMKNSLSKESTLIAHAAATEENRLKGQKMQKAVEDIENLQIKEERFIRERVNDLNNEFHRKITALENNFFTHLNRLQMEFLEQIRQEREKADMKIRIKAESIVKTASSPVKYQFYKTLDSALAESALDRRSGLGDTKTDFNSTGMSSFTMRTSASKSARKMNGLSPSRHSDWDKPLQRELFKFAASPPRFRKVNHKTPLKSTSDILSDTSSFFSPSPKMTSKTSTNTNSRYADSAVKRMEFQEDVEQKSGLFELHSTNKVFEEDLIQERNGTTKSPKMTTQNGFDYSPKISPKNSRFGSADVRRSPNRNSGSPSSPYRTKDNVYNTSPKILAAARAIAWSSSSEDDIDYDRKVFLKQAIRKKKQPDEKRLITRFKGKGIENVSFNSYKSTGKRKAAAHEAFSSSEDDSPLKVRR